VRARERDLCGVFVCWAPLAIFIVRADILIKVRRTDMINLLLPLNGAGQKASPTAAAARHQKFIIEFFNACTHGKNNGAT
jgi:hypothetical protein